MLVYLPCETSWVYISLIVWILIVISMHGVAYMFTVTKYMSSYRCMFSDTYVNSYKHFLVESMNFEISDFTIDS